MRQVRITVAALITLASFAVNAVFHLPWFDSMAALAVIPFLIQEGRSAWQRHAMRMLLKACSCRFPDFTSLYTDYQL
jgi:hypothetical protein